MNRLTKARAREILQHAIRHRVKTNKGNYLPIHDEVYLTELNGNELAQYTFRGLLCIAYDLEEKPNV